VPWNHSGILTKNQHSRVFFLIWHTEGHPTPSAANKIYPCVQQTSKSGGVSFTCSSCGALPQNDTSLF